MQSNDLRDDNFWDPNFATLAFHVYAHRNNHVASFIVFSTNVAFIVEQE